MLCVWFAMRLGRALYGFCLFLHTCHFKLIQAPVRICLRRLDVTGRAALLRCVVAKRGLDTINVTTKTAHIEPRDHCHRSIFYIRNNV